MSARSRGIPEILDSAPAPAASDSTARRARTALLLCVLLVLVLIAWSTWEHIATRLEREHALAAQVTTGVANELDGQFGELRSQLGAFVAQERTLIARVAAQPDSSGVRNELWSRIRLAFPDAKGAAILSAADSSPTALGEWPADTATTSYLGGFLRGDLGSIRISADPIPQIDLAAVYQTEAGQTGALALQMRCDAICRPLIEAAPEGHRLAAVPADGTTSPPAGTLLADVPLGNSGWQLEDRLEDRYRADLILHRAGLGLGLAAAFLLAVYRLYRWVRAMRRRALRRERDLRESQGKLEVILSATIDGIMIMDTRGRIELFNPAAEMMFGRLAKDVNGTSAERLLPNLLGSGEVRALLGSENSGQATPVVREALGLRRDGTEFPVRLWLSSLRFDKEPHLIVSAEDLTEQERSAEHLSYLEKRDLLTGLLNRSEFERRLQALSAEGAVPGPHVLCDVDLDQFQLLNDTSGHEAGDALLKQLAVLIRARTEKTSIIARIGGDEFGILLPGCNTDEARKTCSDLQHSIRSFPFTWRDQSFDLSVCVGLVEFQPGNESASSLASKADIACHLAKSHGRDRIQTYHDGDAELTRHHGDMRLVTAISEALSDDRFHIYAQPIIPLQASNGTRRHFEVLVRMVDESGTPVVPDHFIPAAERYILMPAVDRWIINRLFSLHAETLRTWHDLEPDGFLFAVNLSATSLADEDFLRFLKRQFSDWSIPYPSICLEITETAAIRDLDHARTVLEELSTLGCALALDDFGTGLSNFGYLRQLPFHYLKIDGGFVRNMTNDAVNHALVESINQIGHVLDLKTIAEWVEDQATIEQLRGLGVDFAQGYGVGDAIAVSGLTLQDTRIVPRQ